MAKKARVLVTTIIDGKTFQPDDVIEISSAQLKALAGAVDASSEAVKYCVDKLGKTVIKLDDDFIGPRKPAASAAATDDDKAEG